MSQPAILEANWAALRARSPELAARVAAATVPPTHEVVSSARGDPTLRIAGVLLHGLADPVSDAGRWAASACGRLAAAGAERAAVVGLGLGYHLEALAERFGGGIAIIEPDLAIWRVALAHRDLSSLLARAELHAGDPEPAASSGDADRVEAPCPRTRVLVYSPALLVPGGGYRRAQESWQASAALAGLRLRVLVVSPIYGGSWPMAGYATNALRTLGHDAHLLDLGSFHGALESLGGLGASRGAQARSEARFCDALGEAIVGAVESLRPDVVLALAQAPLGSEALSEIARLGAVRVLWFVEDFRRFTYWRDVARHYDLVLTIQDEECLEAIGGATDGTVAYLPCAFDPAVHRPLELAAAERATLASPVSFVGAGYRNRRKALRSMLDLGLKIWGSDWHGADDLTEAIQRDGDRVSSEDSVRIFHATDVNLNLHSSTWHDGVDPAGDFVNPRTFELAGCGAFQIVDQRRLLPALFVPGIEMAVAANVAEMKDMTRHFLARPEERAAMAARARARAVGEHTYVHRMQSMLAMVLRSHEDHILGRARPVTVGDVRHRSAAASQAIPARVGNQVPFTLDELARDICARPGDLSENEAIFLFLHQFDELYLAEHRT